jgi:hypothetical protein
MSWIEIDNAAIKMACSRKTIERKIKEGLISAKKEKRGRVYVTLVEIPDENEKIQKNNELNPSAEMETFSLLDGKKQAYVLQWIDILQKTASFSKKDVINFCENTKNSVQNHDNFSTINENFDASHNANNKNNNCSYQNGQPQGLPLRISVGTYYRNKSLYQKFGIAGLAPDYGKSKGFSCVTDEMYDLFKSLYLVEGGPTAQDCAATVFGVLKKKYLELSYDEFPSYKAFERKVKTEIGEAYIALARKGERYYKRYFEYYIARDWSEIEAGSWWVSDHHQLDVLVYSESNEKGQPQDKKLVRPWVTAWMDLRTDKMLAAYIHEDAPNSDHIFQAFAWAVEIYGLPDGIYLDNGKDYRVLDLTGNPKRYKYWQEESEHHARSLMAILDVKVLFAREYNAQAKPIEPRFRTVCNGFSKFAIGYCAGNVVKRPENLAKDIKKEIMLDFKTLKTIFEQFVFDIYNKKPSQGNLLAGKCPDEAFELYRKKHIRNLSKNSMCLLYMRGKTFTIGRKGIEDKDLDVWYWNDMFLTMRGERVYIRRDMRDFSQAYVFDVSTDKFICVAALDTRISALADDDKSKEALKIAIKRKHGDLKKAKKAIKTERIPLKDIMDAQKTTYEEIAKNKKKDNGEMSEKGDKKVECNSPQQPQQVVTTELDVAAAKIEKSKQEIDLYDFVPEEPEYDPIDDIDVWDLKSAFL